MTEEEMVRCGAVLKNLVDTEEFTTVFDLLQNDYKTRLMMTSFEKREERESLYRQYHALDDLMSGIYFMVSKAQERIYTVGMDD